MVGLGGEPRELRKEEGALIGSDWPSEGGRLTWEAEIAKVPGGHVGGVLVAGRVVHRSPALHHRTTGTVA